jgi:hypothetical protein
MLFGSEHYPMYSDGFSAEDKKNALAHLKSLETFSFIYSVVVLYRVLSYFREPMKRLQGISQDLSSGLRMIKDCQKDIVAIRNDTDELTAFSDQVFSHCCRVAAKLYVTPAVPRICQRQQHCSNSQYSDPEEYFS